MDRGIPDNTWDTAVQAIGAFPGHAQRIMAGDDGALAYIAAQYGVERHDWPLLRRAICYLKS